MDVKPGFKRTEVGVIPEDWECVRIGDASATVPNAIVGGPFGSDLTSAHYVDQGVPVVRGANMSSGYVTGPFVFVTPDKARSLSANIARPGDLVLTQRGTLGQVSLVPSAEHSAYLLSQSQMKVTLASRRYEPEFVRQFFASPTGQKQILESAIQTGIPHTNLAILRSYRIPAPSLEEQRLIAFALSETDTLLNSLECLITKRRDLKQAAMQQLLTGQTRLPGFHGEWEMKRLGDIVDTDPEQLGPNTAPRFAFNYIALEGVDEGVLTGFSEQRFDRSPSRARRRLRKGDILVSTVRPNLRSHLLFDVGDGPWVCSTGFCVLRCIQGVSHSAFIFQHFFGSVVNRQIDALLTGSSYPAISNSDVRSLRIPCPSFPEQVAIAAVLSEMDAELSALEARRDKTFALKQAMMQELLTGRTRLV